MFDDVGEYFCLFVLLVNFTKKQKGKAVMRLQILYFQIDDSVL